MWQGTDRQTHRWLWPLYILPPLCLMQNAIKQLKILQNISRWYLDAVSEDGTGHLKQQCQHQHPDCSDTTAVQQRTARVCTAAIHWHRPLIRTSQIHINTTLTQFKLQLQTMKLREQFTTSWLTLRPNSRVVPPSSFCTTPSCCASTMWHEAQLYCIADHGVAVYRHDKLHDKLHQAYICQYWNYRHH